MLATCLFTVPSRKPSCAAVSRLLRRAMSSRYASCPRLVIPRLVATARSLYAIGVMSGSDEFQARLRTLEELRAAGIDPYPHRAHPTHTAAQVRALLQEREGDHVAVAGRIVGGIRTMGKLAFVHIQDGSGRIQLSIQRPVVGEEGWALLRRLHAGDFVEAAGET